MSDAHAMRRQILGDAYVDAQGAGDEFQEYVTSVAWSVWARPGLAPRDRSLMVLAMTAALGRMEEFKLHARSAPRAGVTDADSFTRFYWSEQGGSAATILLLTTLGGLGGAAIYGVVRPKASQPAPSTSTRPA